MNRADFDLRELFNEIPTEEREEAKLSFAVSNRLADLLDKNKLTKRQFAKAIGKSPSMVTLWLSGQHNFTLSTLAKISTYFNEPIIEVSGRSRYDQASN